MRWAIAEQGISHVESFAGFSLLKFFCVSCNVLDCKVKYFLRVICGQNT